MSDLMPEDYDALGRIFTQACALPPAGRDAFLDEACRDRPALRGQIESMLEQDQLAGKAERDVGRPTTPERAGDMPTIGLCEESPGDSARDPHKEFAGYELISEIGRGGMGVVYKAQQKHPKRTVAVKMIRAGRFASSADVQRFYTEAEATATVDHEGVVPVYEAGEYEGEHFFSMKFVDGESLAHHLDKGCFSRRDLLQIFRTVCEAMAHCHQRGIVHRDIKPSNILIDRQGRPRITDFGLAKHLHQDSTLTLSGDVMGTPGYMPPEQASGLSDTVGPEADVYALGAILYHILTGRPPVQAENVNLAGALRLVQEHDVVPPRSVDRRLPRDLDTVVMKCLDREPTRRYGDAGELAAELERYLDNEPVLAKPLNQLSVLMRWARQQPGLATTWAALALFYMYHLYCFYVLRPPDIGIQFHYISTTIVTIWAVGAWGFQRALLVSGERAIYLFLWVTLDVALLTALLGATSGAKSSVVLVYHVLVAGAVLRFRPDLVGYVTLLSLAGYFFHVARAWLYVPQQLPTVMEAVPFILTLLMIGLIQYFALRRSRAAYELLSLARVVKSDETK